MGLAANEQRYTLNSQTVMTMRESEPETELNRSEAGERVAIVGGGIMGMSLALRLRERGLQVTLYEARASTGGLACAQEIGGWTWDRFYHVTLLSDTKLRELLGEIGADDTLTIAVADRTVRLLHPRGYDYFELLRSKLRWGQTERAPHGPSGS